MSPAYNEGLGAVVSHVSTVPASHGLLHVLITLDEGGPGAVCPGVGLQTRGLGPLCHIHASSGAAVPSAVFQFKIGTNLVKPLVTLSLARNGSSSPKF